MVSSSTAVILCLVLGLEGRNGLSLDTPSLHFTLELLHVTNTGKEVGLSASVAIKGGKPLVPLHLFGRGFLKVANHGEFLAGKESVVDDILVLPAIGRS